MKAHITVRDKDGFFERHEIDVIPLAEHESELSTLRQRAERAEAELEKCKWNLGNATGNYLTLLAEPCIVCEQKQYEAEAAQSTIAELTATVERMREAIEWCYSVAGNVSPDWVGSEIKHKLRAALGEP